MIPRYTPPEIASIFSDESRLRRWLQIELLVAEAWAALGEIPAEVLPRLKLAQVDPERVAQLEAQQGHDVAAFVAAVAESVGEGGQYLHLGLTSSDVLDTALATQLQDAWRFIDAQAQELESSLRTQALRHRQTLMMGRTHGVHAEPLTLGLKFANFFDEVRRSRARLAAAAAEVAVGKVSGPVGTYSSVPPQVEEDVCRALGLTPAAVATQVVARDRHAAFLTAMALLAAVLERMATGLRLLQISEVSEVEEPFSERQKGSSAMPHKRNPILAERICGLARLLRGNAHTAMEDVALWHERDISHSSAERVIIPDSCAILAYAIQLSRKIVDGLQVDSRAMLEHVNSRGRVGFSQRLLNALIRRGHWSRESAYRKVQSLSAAAIAGNLDLRQLAESDAEIAAVLPAAEMDAVFDVQRFVQEIDGCYSRLGLLEPAPTGSGGGTADAIAG